VDVIWKLGGRALRYGAKIERVAARITSSSGGVALHARLDDPQKPLPIRSGAFVEVVLADHIYKQALRLPQSALYGQNRIYVIGADGRLEERRVKLLALDGAYLLARGDVRAGEKVVVSRLSTIGPGLKVREIGGGMGEKAGGGSSPGTRPTGGGARDEGGRMRRRKGGEGGNG
jgi:membrane fusion protein (multidrug efflux system)